MKSYTRTLPSRRRNITHRTFRRGGLAVQYRSWFRSKNPQARTVRDFRMAINELPQDQKDVFLLRRDGLEPIEIAKELAMSEVKVRITMQEALVHLSADLYRKKKTSIIREQA